MLYNGHGRSFRHTAKIEVEVETVEQVDEALEAGADILLLDNMPPGIMQRVVQEVEDRAVTEASGGITLDKVKTVAATGVDLISVGALTHSAMPMDISFNIDTRCRVKNKLIRTYAPPLKVALIRGGECHKAFIPGECP